MEVFSYDALPPEARAIRDEVFVKEQEYRPEYDEWDDQSTHLLVFDDTRAVATCRFYADPNHPVIMLQPQRKSIAPKPTVYVIARLAVVPDMRGHHIGSNLLAEAERRIAQAGGTVAAVHAEDTNFAFYQRLGYTLTDALYDNGTHGWLIKPLPSSQPLQ